MKKTSPADPRDEAIAHLEDRVARLERSSAALTSRMLLLFGPVTKPADPPVSAVAAIAARKVALPGTR